MTKKDFLEQFNNCEFNDFKNVINMIHQFIKNNNENDVIALLGESFVDVDNLTVYTDGVDIEKEGLSDAKKTIQYALVFDYYYSKYCVIPDIGFREGYYNYAFYYDYEFSMDDPDLDNIKSALIEISKSDAFEDDETEDLLDSGLIAYSILENVAMDIVKKFEKQVEEQHLNLNPDVRTLLLCDFLGQYKEGITNPIIGRGIVG